MQAFFDFFNYLIRDIGGSYRSDMGVENFSFLCVFFGTVLAFFVFRFIFKMFFRLLG